MQPNPNRPETLRERLERDLREIQECLADPCLDELGSDDLVLERLPSGELAWLRPDTRYVVTAAGRAAMATP